MIQLNEEQTRLVSGGYYGAWGMRISYSLQEYAIKQATIAGLAGAFISAVAFPFPGAGIYGLYATVGLGFGLGFAATYYYYTSTYSPSDRFCFAVYKDGSLIPITCT